MKIITYLLSLSSCLVIGFSLKYKAIAYSNSAVFPQTISSKSLVAQNNESQTETSNNQESEEMEMIP